ncbi:hypothetical protein [Jiella sp. M17.18]|uniref:hypothetical protein n=1 Tax=Jiella sp. M17.18 TaxID=3234247 RepID=UPI0034DF9925
MGMFRQLLRDRATAFAAALILVQLLLVQAVASMFGCAAAGAAGIAGVTVICHGSLADTGSPGAPARPHDCCLDCQCGIACDSAAQLLADLPPQTDLGAAFVLAGAGADGFPPGRQTPETRPPPVILPQPRGPPFLSA